MGVIAVTLLVDYGTFFNSGDTTKFNAKMEVGFNLNVTAQSGNFYETATLLEHWGPDSGGFPALAAFATPLMSDIKFGKLDNGGSGGGNVSVKADSVQFEKAASEVTQAANPKLIEVFTSFASK